MDEPRLPPIRFRMERLEHYVGWKVIDTLTSTVDSTFLGPEADRQAFAYTTRVNRWHREEIKRAHEEALVDDAVWETEHGACLSDAERLRNHELRRSRYGTCRSWRVYWERWRPMISRCAWPADHVRFSKWHCAEDTTSRVWEVSEHERGEF
jgi:hypothetical protein